MSIGSTCLACTPIGGLPTAGAIIVGTDFTHSADLLLTITSTYSYDMELECETTLVITGTHQMFDIKNFTMTSPLVITTTSEFSATPSFSLSTDVFFQGSHVLGGVFTHTHPIIITSDIMLGSGIIHNHNLIINSSIELIAGSIYEHNHNLIITSSAILRVPVDGNLANLRDTAICVNLATGGHSTYRNFSFDTFVSNGNKYFASLADVVFELTGKLDNTAYINWSVKYPNRDFNTPVKKNVQDAYIYMRSNGDVEITTTIDDEKYRGDYIITTNDLLGIYRRRKLLPKGIIGTTWQFEIKSVYGSDIELNRIELSAEKTQRVR